jgi:predicted HTH transcriptional regulator
MAYNPFNKRIGERLCPNDLQDLVKQEVAEGYFIECKRQLPKTLKIARSIALFANTYGGWYIVGAKTNEHNVITAIDGFTQGSCPDPISVVREAAKQHTDPVPMFFVSLVELDTGNLVLVVNVPGNQDTPFITSDGRLYRRTHDSSDPVPETSRYALDQLMERGQLASKRFALKGVST